MSALDKLVELFPNRVSDNINLDAYRDDSYKVRVKNASEYRDALLERLKNKEAYGDKTGFSIDEHFRFRPYEMTVWVGYKGHGKSAILSQVLLGLMQSGKRVFVCSPEFHPIELLFRFLVQCVGSDNPRPDEADRLLKFLAKYLWLYDVQASLKPNDLPALCRWVVDNIKPDHIVIDSLMKCGIAPDDYGAQKNLVDKLQTIAHQNPLHFHLVAHARKGMSDDKPPRLLDIKGASEIADLVENVLSVWRNKPKEMAMSSGDMTKADECDAIFTVEAQRNALGWVGMIPLQFQRASMIYYEQGTQKSFVSILGNEVSL